MTLRMRSRRAETSCWPDRSSTASRCRSCTSAWPVPTQVTTGGRSTAIGSGARGARRRRSSRGSPRCRSRPTVALAATISQGAPDLAGAGRGSRLRPRSGGVDRVARRERRRRRGQRIYQLDRVERLRAPSGHPRLAAADDGDLLVAWMHAFITETEGGGEAPPISGPPSAVASTTVGISVWDGPASRRPR